MNDDNYLSSPFRLIIHYIGKKKLINIKLITLFIDIYLWDIFSMHVRP